MSFKSLKMSKESLKKSKHNKISDLRLKVQLRSASLSTDMIFGHP